MARPTTPKRGNKPRTVADDEMEATVEEFSPDPNPPEFDQPIPPEQGAQSTNDVDAQPINGASSVPDKRVYANEVVIDHDLYRLKLTDMKKNVAWQAGQFDMVSVPHEHFFHTVDSNGIKQKHSNLVGSHFHVMTIEKNPTGGPPIVKCGPAVKEVKKIMNGRTVKTVEPYLRYVDDQGSARVDNHTHVVKYEKSNRVPIRKINDEAIKIIGLEAAKGKPIPEVIG